MRTTLTTVLVSGLMAASSPAWAQTVDDDDKPPEPVVLKHIPPRFSWDFAVQASYSMLPQFTNAPPWMGLGVRGTWGKHFGAHRVGVGASISLEGPIGVQWGNYLDPWFAWDFVSQKGLWVGASAGPTMTLNVEFKERAVFDTSFDIGPMVAARIGYSTPWSLVIKRFFVGVEPKMRVIDGRFGFGGAIVIGTGTGY